MINANILEKFLVKPNELDICSHSPGEYKYGYKNNCMRTPDRTLNEFEYPRRILLSENNSELFYYWSEQKKKLCFIENSFSWKTKVCEINEIIRKKEKESDLQGIRPKSWYNVYFSRYGGCKMFISQDDQLFFIENSENRRIKIDDFKSIIKIFKVNEGVIVGGYSELNSTEIKYKSILGHPFEEPVNLNFENTLNLDITDKDEQIRILWSSSEYPLIMGFDTFKKRHILYNYKALDSTLFRTLLVESIWEESYSNENNEYADSVFITSTLFDNSFNIVYHIPANSELRYLTFPKPSLQDLCNNNINDKQIVANMVNNVKGVVPLCFGTQNEKYELFGVEKLYGFKKTDSNKLFNQEKSQEIPKFLVLLSSTGELLLYTGFMFIVKICVSLQDKPDHEILGISSGLSNKFDVLLKYPDIITKHESLMGIRCSLSLIPEDLLVQILISLLHEITSTNFSLSLFTEIVKYESQKQWKVLCNLLLGNLEKASNINDYVDNLNDSIEPPFSNEVYKKIKLFSDKDTNSDNKSIIWQQISSFWIRHIERNGKSPFDRKEFSNLVSKRIIPHVLLRRQVPRVNIDESFRIQNHKLEVSAKTIYILHGLYEELNLFQLFNIYGNFANRLKNDILIPISKRLDSRYYQEYYQYLDSTFNLNETMNDHDDINTWDLPPVLFDKLYHLSKSPEIDRGDNYYKMIQAYYPLQLFVINFYEKILQGSHKDEILDYIYSNGIDNGILPLLNPIISFPIEKFLICYAESNPSLSLSNGKYLLLGRFDLLRSAKGGDKPYYSNPYSKTKTQCSDSLAATVLPHGRNTVDDQKSMLENLQVYYSNKMDSSRRIISEKKTILDRWKHGLSEYSNSTSFELSFEWCFQVFSFDCRFCEALELLSLHKPPHVLLQRSSGAYPIDEESWDEFQRQRIVDAVQLVHTNLLGRAACTMGGSNYDITLTKLHRPTFVNKVYEVASNSLINVDNERFREVCLETSIWNDFYLGVSEALKFCKPRFKLLEASFNSNKKAWLMEQLETFSTQEDTPFISGFLFGISLNGFFESSNSGSKASFPIILEPKEIYGILESDGQSIKTSAVLLATAIGALKTQNNVLLRLYLMHLPSILPNIYTKSLQITNINQYSALISIGLLFSQSRSKQIIEILFSEFLRTISDVDEQASISPCLYSISAAISLGMVIQSNEESKDEPSCLALESEVTDILLCCISGNRFPKFISNLASGPNLEHYTEFSGLRFKFQNDFDNKENYNRTKLDFSRESDKFSNSSKSYCLKSVDSTILGIPAAISLAIIHMKSKNKTISSLIPIPYSTPEDLVNFRPEILIFMLMSKIVIEWDEDCIPNSEYLCKHIPNYLWYLPSDKIFPFPITNGYNLSDKKPIVDTKLAYCVSTGILDWIHCIQARIAILSGIIWGLGIVFSGKRSRELKDTITIILEYLDKIPLIQIPICIASTMRDKGTCSFHISIDRWSRELCIRVCLTSISICFSGSGDRQILRQIKYFRGQLLESSQLLWTSSTAISPFSIFSIPPIEHVYSQLMAYNDALGFLFLSSGHISFSNNNKLGSTLLLLATHPIYPKDSSDISTPGIIFQPLRYLFIIAANLGRKVVVPRLIKPSLEEFNRSETEGIISEENIHVPLSVMYKTGGDKAYKIEYFVLPSILPHWDDIINIEVIGDSYYPLSIDLGRDKDCPCLSRLHNGELWVQLKNGYNSYTWDEANHIIKNLVDNPFPKLKLNYFPDHVILRKQLLCKYFGEYTKLSECDSKIQNQCEEINHLNDNFSQILVLEEQIPLNQSYYRRRISNNTRITKHWNILGNYIEQINSTCSQATQDGYGCLDTLIPPDIVKTLRITLNIDNNKVIRTILTNINKKLQTQISAIIRCLRYYYGTHNGTRIPSCNEKRLLRLFLSLNGMPLASHFNYVLKKKIQLNKKIDTLLKENFNGCEQIIIPILNSEFPTLSTLGLHILKIFIQEKYSKTKDTGSNTTAHQRMKSMLARIISSKSYI
ncbi:E3 ubiquitin ligase [Cryptosporidium felis]|nr:E3 ubiquitin ligase [Cryptosporidium felis]